MQFIKINEYFTGKDNFCNKLLKIIITTIIIFVFMPAFAQLSEDIQPLSYLLDIETNIPLTEIDNTKSNIILSDSEFPKQAGYTIPYTNNLNQSGIWKKTKEGNIWLMELSIKNEKALNLYFEDFFLSDDEWLFVYSPDHSVLHGAFSKKNNGSYFATDFIPGDRLIIEFNTKRNIRELPFKLNEIGILVNGSITQRGFGDAGSCEVHVNCSEGENWQLQKDGVARILLKDGSGTFWCTGSLVNNTLNNGEPYFLTANHCGETSDSSDYLQWLFYFNYQSENCEQPLLQPEYQSLTGAKLLAKSGAGTTTSSDFKLLKLNNVVPKSYKPYYNGWDRSGNGSETGVTIHHPQGDLKMISTYNSRLISTGYFQTIENPDALYWMVYWTKTTNGFGVTEGGSSGSPIFSSSKLITGTLTGGGASCTQTNKPDYYGKFNSSWQPTASDSSNQLSYWLDPINTGTMTLEGTNLDSTNIFARFSSNIQSVLLGNEVTFTNTSYGNITSYQWYFEGGDPEYSEKKDPGKILYNAVGDFDVRLIVLSTDGSDTLTSKNYIKVIPSVSPVPSDGTVRFAFGNEIPENIVISGFDNEGKEVPITVTYTGDNYIIINLVTESIGLYFIRLNSNSLNNTYKIIKAR